VTRLATVTPSPTTAAVSGVASPDTGVGLVGTLLVVVVAVILLRRVA
jgi:hypothetical protein